MDGDMQRGMSIWESDSDEEVTKFILENPLSTKRAIIALSLTLSQ